MPRFSFGNYNWSNFNWSNWASSYLSNFNWSKSSSWSNNNWTSSRAKKAPELIVTNVPTDITVDDSAGSFVDLSAMKLRYKGASKEIITITLTTDAGTFESVGNRRVDVTGSGTDTITFTGRAGQIDRFLNNVNALTYNVDPNTPNAGTASFTMSAQYGNTNTTIATIAATVPEVTVPVTEMSGTSGDDELTGTDNSETILGLAGDDDLDGLGGDDTVEGNAGNDVIRGGAGADILVGGAGEDTLQYVGSAAGVNVDLNASGIGQQSASGGDAQGDQISEFENVYGTEFADVLTGNSDDNVLFGYGGSDVIDGGAGDDVIRGGADADTLTGGTGTDWLRYLGSTSGVTVDLNLDTAGFHQTSGGDAEGDIASGFENIYGSDFDDVLTGDGGANYIIGFGGDDTIDGGAGNDLVRGGAGGDTMIGGAGTDTLQYDDSATGVTVDLSLNGTGIQQTSAGDASGDIISEFENLTGSDFGDVLTGDSGRNIILGLDGDDTIDGGDGYDVIRGGAGADTMIGGAGSDVLQYAGSSAGVTVNLTADAAGFQSASGGDAAGDIISEFESVYGSNFGDVLTGNASRNILYGYSGDDTIDGGAGNDVLRGLAGNDTFVFSTALGDGNVDRIVDFSSADDTIHLDSNVFAGLTLGPLDAAEFLSNGTGLAETAAQRVIYDSATGNLNFDSDGTGSAEGVLFATLATGLTIDESDFFVI
ncbi:hemolysin type calcium-binding protein [Litoreibacter meonggei]|uniref:Hemolysin type calcium-binding protein n=1 Tax=Litoreibacter meonggei TaxID=1049199 RepID=A0A497X265_9RHOB|nr:calcium-binding protein [Litoreibacter meonggei]RLJ59546.1 hemolysin type calcium-binding protein [Litoreibacter meonggei]